MDGCCDGVGVVLFLSPSDRSWRLLDVAPLRSRWAFALGINGGAEREFISAEVFADGRRVFGDAANLPVGRCGGDACGTQAVALSPIRAR